MRPHPKSLTQPTLPPAVEQAVRDVRAILAAVPQLAADQDGSDVYLSTGELLAAKEPLVFGVIYTDDDQGKAIADLVLRMLQLLGPILEHFELPIARTATSVAIVSAVLEERPPKAELTAPPALSKDVADAARLHLEALEVAQMDPTQSRPRKGWEIYQCLCGKAFQYPETKTVKPTRCFACLGSRGRNARLNILKTYL